MEDNIQFDTDGAEVVHWVSVDGKNLIFGDLTLVICLFSVYIFFDLDLPPGMEPAGCHVDNASLNESSDEMTAYMLLKFKTLIKGYYTFSYPYSSFG